jgi:hypothetical protein
MARSPWIGSPCPSSCRTVAVDCLADGSYGASQGLADGSLSLIYPGVRKPGGTCIAGFRPALVANVRKGKIWTFRWEEKADPIIEG